MTVSNNNFVDSRNQKRGLNEPKTSVSRQLEIIGENQKGNQSERKKESSKFQVPYDRNKQSNLSTIFNSSSLDYPYQKMMDLPNAETQLTKQQNKQKFLKQTYDQEVHKRSNSQIIMNQMNKQINVIV